MTNKEIFRQWLKEAGHTPKTFSEETQIPHSALNHLLYGDQDFSPEKMTIENRNKLYQATKLEIFKTTPQMIAGKGVDLSKLNPWQIDLLNWMSDNAYNVNKLSIATNIPRTNIRLYCTVPCSPPRMKKNRDALYNYTALANIESNGERRLYMPKRDVPLEPAPASLDGIVYSLVLEIKQLRTALVERLPIASRPETDTELVQRTVALFGAFVDTLENYKTRQNAVEQLKQAIPAQNAGYLISCLNALYQKDAFNKWMLQQPMPLGVK